MIIIQLDSEGFSNAIKDAVRQALADQPTAPLLPAVNDLMRIDQAAEFLGLSKDTIYRLVGRSEIPVCKKTNRLYFSRQQLTAWVKNGRMKTASEIEGEAKHHLQVKKKGGRRG